jgi:hypothetical protein
VLAEELQREVDDEVDAGSDNVNRFVGIRAWIAHLVLLVVRPCNYYRARVSED